VNSGRRCAAAAISLPQLCAGRPPCAAAFIMRPPGVPFWRTRPANASPLICLPRLWSDDAAAAAAAAAPLCAVIRADKVAMQTTRQVAVFQAKTFSGVPLSVRPGTRTSCLEHDCGVLRCCSLAGTVMPFPLSRCTVKTLRHMVLARRKCSDESQCLENATTHAFRSESLCCTLIHHRTCVPEHPQSFCIFYLSQALVTSLFRH
jgi:hypothetical protein